MFYNINLKIFNIKRECIFFKAKIFFQNNKTNKNGIIKKFNRYNKVC